jgi:hypothetical protein
MIINIYISIYLFYIFRISLLYKDIYHLLYGFLEK